MLRLRAIARAAVASTLITVGLGCTGIMSGAMDLAGIEMRIGPQAKHPPDFPAMPLTVGEKAMSLKMTAKGDQVNLPEQIPMPPSMPLDETVEYDIEAVIYAVPSSDRPDAVANAVVQVLSAGFAEIEDPPKPEDELKEIHISTSEKAIFAIVGSDNGSDSSVILIRLQPAKPEVAEVEEPVEEKPAEEEAPAEE